MAPRGVPACTELAEVLTWGQLYANTTCGDGALTMTMTGEAERSAGTVLADAVASCTEGEAEPCECVVLERGVSLQLGRGYLPADIAVAGRPPLRALSQNTPPRAKPAAVSYVRAATREDDEAHAALLRWAKKAMSAEHAEIAARKKALSVDERHAERVARNLAARGA